MRKIAARVEAGEPQARVFPPQKRGFLLRRRGERASALKPFRSAMKLRAPRFEAKRLDVEIQKLNPPAGPFEGRLRRHDFPPEPVTPWLRCPDGHSPTPTCQ
jgi:hypothetical protein